MTDKWKITFFVILILVIIIRIFLFIPKGENETVKVGIIFPLTGGLGEYAESMKNSIDLAIEKENVKDKIQFILEDDKGCNAAQATSAAQKLVNIDGIKAIIGPMCSSTVLSISSITEPNKVVIVTPSATSKSITNAGDYVFRTIASDTDKSIAVAKLGYEKGYRKAALLYDNAQDAMMQQKQDVKETFTNLGGKIVIEESFKTDDKDFRTQLTKIKNSDTDVIFIGALPAELDLILKQIKVLDIKKQIIVSDTSASLIKDETKKIAEGLIFPFSETPNNKEFTEFINLYKSKFEKDPSAFSAESYDASILLIKSIINSDKTGDGIKNKLYEYGKDYYGASGIITFDENGDVIKPITIKTFKDGEIVNLE